LISAISPFGQGIASKVTGFFSSFWNSATPAQKPESASPYTHFMCGCGCEESAEQPQERTFTQLLLPTNPCFPSGLVDRSEIPAQIPPQVSTIAQPQVEQVPPSQSYRTISRLRDVRYLSDEAFYNRNIPSQSLIALPKKPSAEFEKITTHTTNEIVYLSRVIGNPYADIHARVEEDFDELEEFLFPHNPHAGIHARIEEDFGEYDAFASMFESPDQAPLGENSPNLSASVERTEEQDVRPESTAPMQTVEQPEPEVRIEAQLVSQPQSTPASQILQEQPQSTPVTSVSVTPSRRRQPNYRFEKVVREIQYNTDRRFRPWLF
jgi:hypothetical protein